VVTVLSRSEIRTLILNASVYLTSLPRIKASENGGQILTNTSRRKAQAASSASRSSGHSVLRFSAEARLALGRLGMGQSRSRRFAAGEALIVTPSGRVTYSRLSRHVDCTRRYGHEETFRDGTGFGARLEGGGV
jgi:hypothetical protein